MLGGVAIALVLAATGAGAPATVTVDASRRGRAVPPSFLGISIEWDSIEAYAGPPGHRRASLGSLVAPIEHAAGTGLALRVGGDTEDQAWWNPHHRLRPPAVLQDIRPRTLDAVGSIAGMFGGPVTLGVNLPLGDPSNAATMVRALRGMLRRWRTPKLVLAAHLYALPRCDGPTPGRAWLLSAAASRGRVATLAPLAAIARRANLPWRVTELQSAVCGGRFGLSDGPAAALWLTDTLFALLRLGAAQADVHTWDHARYALFAPTRGGGAIARPPLAGLTAFARAAPSGSRLVAASVRGGGGLRAWATVGPSGRVNVALLAPAAARARVRAGTGSACAVVWNSAGRVRTLCPVAGAYTVSLPARSMAVLGVPAS